MKISLIYFCYIFLILYSVVTLTKSDVLFEQTSYVGVDIVGVYGNKLEADTSFHPGTRLYPSTLVVSHDSNEYMYLLVDFFFQFMIRFGGFGKDETNSDALLGDFWRYNLNNGEWTWISGPKTHCTGAVQSSCSPLAKYTGAVSYNTEDKVYPGGRRGASMWESYQDGGKPTIIMMGGLGYMKEITPISLHGIWQYSINGNEWAKRKIFSPSQMDEPLGNEGCEDLYTCAFSLSNHPGGREGMNYFRLPNDNIVLFGGRRRSRQDYNDIWEYDNNGGDGTFKFVTGSFYVCDAGFAEEKGSFFNSNETESVNRPRSRAYYASWSLQNAGESVPRFYIFGGINDCELGSTLNDLWRYNHTIMRFLWIWGSNSHSDTDKKGRYHLEGNFHKDNGPGTRGSPFTTYIDDGTDFLLVVVGGLGIGKEGYGFLNDFWMFDFISETWSFLGDPGTLNSYGNFDPPYELPGRYGSFGYENNGVTTLFGGYSRISNIHIGSVLDTWTFTFNTSCLGIPEYSPSVCNSHGFCYKNDSCFCDNEYEGTWCDLPKRQCDGIVFDTIEPEKPCNEVGKCLDWEECDCNPGHYGDYCYEEIPTYGEFRKIDKVNSIIIPYKVRLEKITIFSMNCSKLITNYQILGNSSWCYIDFESSISLLTGVSEYLKITMGEDFEVSDGDSLLFFPLTETINGSETRTIINVTVHGFPDPEIIDDDDDGPIPDKILTPILTGIGILVGVFCVVSIILIFLVSAFYRKKKRLQQKVQRLKHVSVLMLDQDMKRGRKISDLTVDRDLFNISFDDLKLLGVLAKSFMATIFKARYKGKFVCFKCYKTKEIEDQDHLDDFEKEVNMLSSIDHNNVLKYHGSVLQPPRIGIVTEFCGKGDMRIYLEDDKNERLSLIQKVKILKQVADSMCYLHSRSIIHRDLKCENILLTDDLVPKIIDFGLSRVVEAGATDLYMTKLAGTSQYMAPEVTLSSKYGNRCDVFSYSIMIYEVLTEDFFCYGRNIEFNVELKVALDPDFRPSIDKNFVFSMDALEWLVDLMEKCWNHEPDERYSFEEIVDKFVENEDTCYDELEKEMGKIEESKHKFELEKEIRTEKEIITVGGDDDDDDEIIVKKKLTETKEDDDKKEKDDDDDDDEIIVKKRYCDTEEEEEEEEKVTNEDEKEKDSDESGSEKSKKEEEEEDE